MGRVARTARTAHRRNAARRNAGLDRAARGHCSESGPGGWSERTRIRQTAHPFAATDRAHWLAI